MFRRIVTSPLLLRSLSLPLASNSCSKWILHNKLPTRLARTPVLRTTLAQLSSIPADSSAIEADDASMEQRKEPAPDEERSSGTRKNSKGKVYNPVDLATSLEYMKSEVYRDTYQGKPVWFYYRRNFKGHFPPPRTRPNCVVAKKLISSNPCPICRDEYLILDYRNTELLRQFINPITLEIFDTTRTGLCQHQNKKLLLEIAKAQDLGTIETWLPFHLYDYAEYYSCLPEDQLNELLRVSGFEQQLSVDTHGTHTSSADFAELPVNLQNLLSTFQVIPRASLGQSRPPETQIELPKVPNRYKMEETYKALVAKRKKSRTLILP